MVIRMNRHNLSTSNSKMTKHTEIGMTFLFLAKLLCLFLLLLFFAVRIVMPQYEYSYDASLIDKMQRLKSIDEPKIVLIGNSNLSFGIQSELIEEAFGMPVVNMGLHGGVGNAFHEEMAKVNIHEGDIIIVSHTEYNDDDKILDPVIVWLAVENHPQLWQLIRPKDLWQMYLAFPAYFSRALPLWADGSGNEPNYGDIYNRVAFNEYGDNIYERKETVYSFQQGSIATPGTSDTCIERLNELNSYVTERGATLLIAAYPVPDGEYTPDHAAYDSFQQELQDRLDCPFISDFHDYFFGYEYFYDTAYHLTNEGAKLRTEQLIKDLQRYMSSL